MLNKKQQAYCRSLAESTVKRARIIAADYDREPTWWSVDVKIYGDIMLGQYHKETSEKKTEIYDSTLKHIARIVGCTCSVWERFSEFE